MLWLVLWATLVANAYGTDCPPVPEGYTFHPNMDSTSRSSKCFRNRAPASWSVGSQADECSKDPLCKAFQVDYLGSCLKRSVGELFVQKTLNHDVWTAAPCPGIYIDQNDCRHADNVTLMCAVGSIFSVQRGVVRMYPNPAVYRSWGSPLPDIKGLSGGGCGTKGKPIDGCKYGPLMDMKDNCSYPDGFTIRCERGSIFAILGRMARMFPNPRVYKSWGTPHPDVRGITGGGCSVAGLPIEGCVYGPWMDHKEDEHLGGHAVSTITTSLYFPVPDTHFVGAIALANLTDVTPEACEQACTSTPGCFMFETGSGGMIDKTCWLKAQMTKEAVVAEGITAYLPQSARTYHPRNDHSKGGAVKHQQLFVPMPDVHYPGHNIELLRNTNPEACERACLKLPACVMYEVGTLSFAPNQCWLKSAVAAKSVPYAGVVAHVPPAGVDPHAHKAGISAAAAAAAVADHPQGAQALTGFTTMADTHFPGSNMDLLKGTSAEACMQACIAAKGCAMFEVGSGSVYKDYCWLKSAVPNTSFPMKGVAAYVPRSA